jgi:hypothetical protein
MECDSSCLKLFCYSVLPAGSQWIALEILESVGLIAVEGCEYSALLMDAGIPELALKCIGPQSAKQLRDSFQAATMIAVVLKTCFDHPNTKNAQFIDVCCRQGRFGERLAEAIISCSSVVESKLDVVVFFNFHLKFYSLPAVPEQVWDFIISLWGILFVKLPGTCGNRAIQTKLVSSIKGKHPLHQRYADLIEDYNLNGTITNKLGVPTFEDVLTFPEK